MSYVSLENARANLDNDQHNKSFEDVKQNAAKHWEDLLNRIEGGILILKQIFIRHCIILNYTQILSVMPMEIIQKWVHENV